MTKVFIIAGETSGDIHGSALMREMKKSWPGILFRGIGGTLMKHEGLDQVRSVQEMHFMGIIEVIRHLPFIRKTMQDCEDIFDIWKPDLLILIDYPGFNLKLAPLAKKRGIPVMFYISPQLWAWHKSRVNLIRKNVDRMVVLFDFERDFYRKYGVDADFVGHPLLDSLETPADRSSFRSALGIDDEIPVIGLLPGSRMQEIERMLPEMTSSIPLLRKKIGPLKAVLGCAPEIDPSVYTKYIERTEIVPLYGKTRDIMANADAVTVSSGTATLEAGILGSPMLIVYKTSPVTYAIGKSLVSIKNIGLINIVAGRRIVPELWQNMVTPVTIAEILYQLATDTRLRNTIQRSLKDAAAKLGTPGASERAAKVALELLSRNDK